jgi:subtilisin family serine protease
MNDLRFLISILSILVFSIGSAQSSDEVDLKTLSQSSKIFRASDVLAPLSLGSDRIRVVVTLRASSQANALHDQSLLSSNSAEAVKQAGVSVYYDLSNKAIRKGLRQAVAQKLNDFTQRLRSPDINISRKFNYVFGFAAEVTLAGLARLEKNPDVLAIEEDLVLTPHLKQGIPLMNGIAARNSYNGTGIAVAVADTGIDYRHPRLGGGGFPNSKVIGGYDFGENDANPIPSGASPNSHGTQVAGIIAGNLGTAGDYIGGVAPAAKLYALKISHDSDHTAFNSDMVAAWEWALTHKNDDSNNPIMVINTSFGGGEFFSVCDNVDSSMTQAAANAVAAGITIFASSGNDGLCNAMGWPACISHVNSVGAVYDANIGNQGWCVSSSSCQKTLNADCPSGWAAFEGTAADKVTAYSNTASFLSFFASSNNVFTTTIPGAGFSGGDYDYIGGTSAASPYAAGAAVVLQHAAKSKTGSYLTPAQVKSYFQNTGNLVTDSKAWITKPRINLGNAVAALPSDSSPVVIWPILKMLLLDG